MSSTLALLLQQASEVQEAAETGFRLHWIDWIGVGLAGVFGLLGIIRGLWWQVIRLVGLVGAAVLARFLSGPWGKALEDASDMPSEVAQGVVWVGLFVAGIVVAAVLGKLGKKSLQAMQLGLMDRVGGLFAGLATGVFLHISILVVMAHLAPAGWTKETLSETYSRGLLDVVTTKWPILVEKQTEATQYLEEMMHAIPKRSGGGSVVK